MSKLISKLVIGILSISMVFLLTGCTSEKSTEELAQQQLESKIESDIAFNLSKFDNRIVLIGVANLDNASHEITAYNYEIYVDRYTKNMYAGLSKGVTPILNEDGTPMKYEGDI